MKAMRFLSILVITAIMATPDKASSQALYAGSVIVDAHYGFPNFSAILKTAYANSGSEFDLKITGLGPMGARGEYMLTDMFGLGLEVNYTKTGIAFKDSSSGTTYDYEVALSRLRVFPRFNLHFLQSSDVVDVYGVLGAGYHRASYSFTSTDTTFGNENITGLWPVAFRLGIGFRAFFAGVLGAGMEIGLGGGALIAAGLSLRLGYLG